MEGELASVSIMNANSIFGPSTLYVLGNGFDIHHRIPCQYADFRGWLQTNRPEVYAIMSRLYGNHLDSKEWWQDFENSLVDFDVEGYPKRIAKAGFHSYKHELERVYGRETVNDAYDTYELECPDESSSYSHRVGYLAGFEMHQLKELLFSTFEDWVNSLSLPSKRHCLRRIDRYAQFMTFNYTRTLEDVYGIEDECVVHIHGVVGGRGEFVIGHGKTAEQLMQSDLENNAMFRDPEKEEGEDSARLKIFDVLEDEMKKPVQELIQEKKVFFNSLSGIQKVVVLGMSYSPIDIPYLDRVFEVIGKGIEAVLGWHSRRDKENAESFARQARLTNWKEVYL